MIEILTLGENASVPAGSPNLPHVLMVLDQFPSTLGGGERIVLKLAALLPSYGFRVSILTFFVHPESKVWRSAPCPIYLLPLQKTYNWPAFRAAIELKRFIKTQQVRIVQTFFESSDLWAGLVTKAATDAKLIWSRRDMGILRGRKHRAAYRMMAGLPDAVFAVSEQVRRHCIESDGVKPSRVITIYNGLEAADWVGIAAKELGDWDARIATVGNIRRIKGHDVLIRAASKLVDRFPRVSFSIAGDVLEPDYFAELQSLVHDLGLAGQFEFAGGVSDLRAYLSSADIFVLPSRSEGFSNAIVEAMAASLPVIATDVGGNGEAVQDGVTGLIVPADDVGSLTEAMARLLADRETAKAMGRAGRSRAADVFTTDAMMRRTTATYTRLLGDQ